MSTLIEARLELCCSLPVCLANSQQGNQQIFADFATFFI